MPQQEWSGAQAVSGSGRSGGRGGDALSRSSHNVHGSKNINGSAENANNDNRGSESTGGDSFHGTFTHGNFGGRNNQNNVTNYDGNTRRPFRLPKIPLKVFCEYYDIDSRDQERLQNIEFKPGTDLDKVSSEIWKEVGFKALSWNNIKEINQQFLDDVQDRKWDKYYK